MHAYKLVRLIVTVSLLAAAILAYAQTAPAPQGAPAREPDQSPAARPGQVAPPTAQVPDAQRPPTDMPRKGTVRPPAGSAGDNPLVGLSVVASDGQHVGKIVGVKAAIDGRVEEIHVKVGGFLGIGGRVVAIPADQIAKAGDKVQLGLNTDEINNLPAREEGQQG